MKKFDAYIEPEECTDEFIGVFWNVKLYCPKVHIDRLGNTAIVRNK